MKKEKYKDCSFEELMDVEKRLNKDTFFFDRGGFRFEYTNWEEFEPGGEKKLNNEWRDSSFWFIPTQYCKVKIKKKFRGIYQVSIHAFLNEDFRDFIYQKKYERKSERLKKNEKKLNLKENLSELRKEIDELSSEFQRKELEKLRGNLVRYIDRHSVNVGNYEPHFTGNEDGRNTHKMLELIGDVELAFRGVVCGSIYAYEWLIGNYLNSEEQIDRLWDYTSKIVELSKEYLAYQIALKYHKSNAGAPQKVTDYELIPYIRECLKDDSFITTTGKNPGKIKHTPIAQHLFYNTIMFEFYEDDRQLRTRVKDILPTLEMVEKKDGKFFKKRK